mgnify:CR=1 FL=1
MQNYIALILAGGGGTRLWPMSRKEKPKQMLPLVADSSMFKVSVDRLAPLFTPDRIFISTAEAYVEGLRKIVEAHPRTISSPNEIHVNELGSSSINILVYVFFEVKDWSEELKARQNCILESIR